MRARERKTAREKERDNSASPIPRLFDSVLVIADRQTRRGERAADTDPRLTSKKGKMCTYYAIVNNSAHLVD